MVRSSWLSSGQDSETTLMPFLAGSGFPIVPKGSCRQEQKKPTWRNTRRRSTTSAYSPTSPPAGRFALYLVVRGAFIVIHGVKNATAIGQHPHINYDRFPGELGERSRLPSARKSVASSRISDTPSSPDWELTISWNRFGSRPSVRARYPVVISCSNDGFSSPRPSFAKPANKPGLHDLCQNRIAQQYDGQEQPVARRERDEPERVRQRRNRQPGACRDDD